MVVYLYVFALVMGSVLLLASLLLGGRGRSRRGGRGVLRALRSMRFWSFSVAFFGLAGVALDGLGLVDEVPTQLLAASATGVAVGLVGGVLLRG